MNFNSAFGTWHSALSSLGIRHSPLGISFSLKPGSAGGGGRLLGRDLRTTGCWRDIQGVAMNSRSSSVGFHRAGRGAGGLVAAVVGQHRRIGEHVSKPVFDEAPCAAVSRLLLHPANLPGLAIFGQDCLDLLRERIKLFDPDDRYVLAARSGPGAVGQGCRKLCRYRKRCVSPRRARSGRDRRERTGNWHR